jgi:hypothetical protein
MELSDELVRDNLTRKQLAERHGITSDRVIQWLCLLKLPEDTQKQVLALGDNWEKRLLTERELRRLRTAEHHLPQVVFRAFFRSLLQISKLMVCSR